MPNRYLRAGYIDSKRINKLSAEGERMFCRLLVHVDDFGRCEADADLLRGKLFARQLDKITAEHVGKWLDELSANELLQLYQVDGQRYLQMSTWEKGRAKQSKCPQPLGGADKCKQMQTPANICLHAPTDENISPDPDPDPDTDSDNTPQPPRGEKVVVEKNKKDGHERTQGSQKFNKPSIEEIRSRCQEMGYGIDPEEFWNFYESKGWKIGNSPMKSWPAALVTWNKRKETGQARKPAINSLHTGDPTYSKENLDRFVIDPLKEGARHE
jgi:hypothetical protein